MISGSICRLGAFDRLDDPGRSHHDVAQIGRDHVGAIEIVGLQVEPGDVVERPRPAARARHADPLRIAAIAGDRLRRHLEAPGFEQPFEIAGAWRTGRIALARMRGLQLGMRIDKDERLAALQDELVDRVERLLRQALRMHQHQHVDIGRDRIDVGGERLDRIELLQLLHHRHRLGRTAAHHRHHVAFERQAC